LRPPAGRPNASLRAASAPPRVGGAALGAFLAVLQHTVCSMCSGSFRSMESPCIPPPFTRARTPVRARALKGELRELRQPGKKPRRTVNLVNFPSWKVLHCHLCGAAFASASTCAA
jgi:hypothetical protein